MRGRIPTKESVALIGRRRDTPKQQGYVHDSRSQSRAERLIVRIVELYYRPRFEPVNLKTSANYETNYDTNVCT